MKKSIFIAMLIAFQTMTGQGRGVITGRLLDREMDDQPLSYASVVLKGTTIGTETDLEGIFLLTVDPGSYVLVFTFLGYKTLEVPVLVKAGESVTVNQTLGAEEGVSLEEVKLKAAVNREKDKALLIEHRKAVTIDQKIGSEELSKKGVSNVATALTKTSGISKQQGSSLIFVRGLGDRYNVTTLNGLPLPSNNPSNKNIDLNIFSSDIVEFISIDKTFRTNNYGDFSGANIDISSKKYRGSGFLEIGIGSGINSEAISQDQFYLNQGPNASGFYTLGIPLFPLNNYNFTTRWNRVESSSPINKSVSLKMGDSYDLGQESSLNVFGVASFDNGFQFNEGISRGSVNTSGVARRDYDFKRYAYQTNTTAMGNVRFKYKAHQIKYNALMINTSTQKQEEYLGIHDVFDYAPEGGAFLQRAIFDRTELFVQQLLGAHAFSERMRFDWGAAYNFVRNSTPDRRQSLLTPDDWNLPEGPKSFNQTLNQSDNHRLFLTLEEEEMAVNVVTSYQFKKNKEDDFLGKLSFGYSGRYKTVDFEATQFNFNINNSGGGAMVQPHINNVYDLDSYFNQENFNAGFFDIKTFRGGLGTTGIDVLLPQSYGGQQNIHAGFSSLTYAFSSKFTAILGLRVERITQSLLFNTSLITGFSELDQTEILPSSSFKYELTSKQNIKIALSKTYTLPQFKERAPFQFDESPTLSTLGNPALYASTNYNIDLKWDFFPKSEEIISLGIFSRRINNPINKITINSASNDVSWVNSGDRATAFGAEFEVRKDFFSKELDSDEKQLKTKFSGGLNVSYLKTNQDLSQEKVIRETSEAGFPLSVDFSFSESALTGASELLVNADMTYSKEYGRHKSVLGTVSFNYFSDRIFALATEAGRGNIIDAGVPTVDFILKATLDNHLGLGLTAKNILNPKVERTQEIQEVSVSSFRVGSEIKLSLSYHF